jgi:hypothetical protein
MKIVSCIPFTIFAALAFVACEAKVNTSPGPTVKKEETTIVNPAPEKKVENNTTVVNPPEKK